MIEINIIGETEKELFFEVELTNKDATFTFSVEKYSNIENDYMLQRLNSICRREAMQGGIRTFERYIDRRNRRTKSILAMRESGEILPNEEGNFVA